MSQLGKMLVNKNDDGGVIMDEVVEAFPENINEDDLKWYKKILMLIKKILLSIFRFFLSILKILALFFVIVMREEFGQRLRETIKASNTEYNIARGIYKVLTGILKVFVIFLVIIPFIFYKLACAITDNKK